MLKIRNWFDIGVFTIIILSLGIAASYLQWYVVFPGQILTTYWWLVPVNVTSVGLPVCLFVGVVLMRNWQLGEKLERIANYDTLTNVPTRKHFFSVLESRSPDRGAVLMLDIDFFKQVNDTWGHLVGDQVISRVAAILSAEAREGDILCRFGGEEFVMFLEESDPACARDIAERIRARIQDQLINAGKDEVRVTISIGGALMAAADRIESAIQTADEALYTAKSKGRNRVVIANA